MFRKTYAIVACIMLQASHSALAAETQPAGEIALGEISAGYVEAGLATIDQQVLACFSH